LITLPSAELVGASIDNMGMREYRRVNTVPRITYDTPAEKIEGFLEGIKNVILANPNTRKDYFNVVFNDYGAYSLDILLYFFIKAPDWSIELVERQRVLLEILRLAEAMEVRFAFPTQTLQVETLPGETSLLPEHRTDPEALRRLAKDFGARGKQGRPGGSGIFKPPYE
jgi:MscS family membrane protein